MDKPMPDMFFKMMAFMYKFRDLLRPRKNILEEAELKPGFHILDYGCGPGGYSLVAAEMVGPTGKVYALDIHPLAVKRVQDAASKKGLRNVETIHSDCATALENDSVDVVLLTDILHMLSERDSVLEELYRVLKPNGKLSCNDHHMKEQEIISALTEKGLFELSKKGKWTHNFSKLTKNG